MRKLRSVLRQGQSMCGNEKLSTAVRYAGILLQFAGADSAEGPYGKGQNERPRLIGATCVATNMRTKKMLAIRKFDP